MIRVSVPATSANCCVGYDSMGMALEWRAQFTFEAAPALCVTGCPEAYQNRDNLVIRAFEKGCAYLGKEMPPVHLHVESDIPFARGLGSSATCIVGGLAAAFAWHDKELNPYEILALATEMEGHPDNVAPAIFGSLCTSVVDEESMVVCKTSLEPWHALAVIPDYEVLTAKARQCIPDTISHHAAALQAGRAVLFVQGLERGDQQLVCASCKDVLHEPYRAHLIPEYKHLSATAASNQVPLWISGSGSTMLAISRDKEQLKQMAAWVKDKYGFEVRLVEPASEGMKVTHE